MSDDPPVTVVRASSLSDWADCQRRGASRIFWREIKASGYELRYLPMGIAAAIGSGVHKAAETLFIEKAKTGSLPPLTLATDCARDNLVEATRRGVEFDAGARAMTRNRADAVAQAVSMTRAYHHTVAPKVEPLLIEARLEAEVAPGLILSGQPDIVAREPGMIRDLKTSAKAQPGNHNSQLGAYALLARSHGEDIQAAAIDHIQRVKPDKPQPDPIEQRAPIAIAEAGTVSILRHIGEAIRTFREGDARRRLLPGAPEAFLSNPKSYLCSSRYCGAWGTEFCRDWQSKEK